jgi:hypothetical protein
LLLHKQAPSQKITIKMIFPPPRRRPSIPFFLLHDGKSLAVGCAGRSGLSNRFENNFGSEFEVRRRNSSWGNGSSRGQEVQGWTPCKTAHRDGNLNHKSALIVVATYLKNFIAA